MSNQTAEGNPSAAGVSYDFMTKYRRLQNCYCKHVSETQGDVSSRIAVHHCPCTPLTCHWQLHHSVSVPVLILAITEPLELLKSLVNTPTLAQK